MGNAVAHLTLLIAALYKEAATRHGRRRVCILSSAFSVIGEVD